ncbi:uncharacterized protein METZ01_LOCUS487780, partial [marine metagenome]
MVYAPARFADHLEMSVMATRMLFWEFNYSSHRDLASAEM